MHLGLNRVLLALVFLTVLLQARAGVAAPAEQARSLLPPPSARILDLRYSPADTAAIAPISLGRVTDLGPIGRPVVPLVSYKRECEEAHLKRNTGTMLGVMGVLGILSGVLGLVIGASEDNDAVGIIGASALGISSVATPIGFVVGAQAAELNREHGCWGAALQQERTANPLIIEVRGKGSAEPEEDEPEDEGEP